MFRWLLTLLLSIILVNPNGAVAQSCNTQRFGAEVDKIGAELRRANTQSETELRAKFARLAKLKGWPPEAAIERGFEFLNDDQIRTFDAQASELVIRLDQLGDTENGGSSCDDLEELKRVGRQLLEVTAAKQAHISAKLNVAIRPRLARKAAQPKPQTAPTKPTAAPAQAQIKQSDRVGTEAGNAPAKGRLAAGEAWSTKTVAAAAPSETVMAALPPVQPETAKATYGSGEIRAVGRGLFGSLSAELASVIKFAFDSYGKPNGYVLGKEAGASFLAGLRYGNGRLVTKHSKARKIYWQGPSVGTDIGFTGSRVMMLIYNLDSVERIFNRFVGVEGAAYLVGGAGITFHKKGNLVLAPIRTGLGLRLGANVGYLKITRKQRFNPF
ncbi:MAG: EipA family protein [Hyphomicrobiaceae bacterium]